MPLGQHQTPPGPRSLVRLGAAFGLFLAVLLGGVLLAVRLTGPATKPKPVKADTQSRPDEFFYTAIGTAPATLTAPATPITSEMTSYTLELSVVTQRDVAEQTIDDLHARGVDAYYTPLTRAGRVVYRIRRGMFGGQKEAERAAIALHKAFAIEAKVVKLQ